MGGFSNFLFQRYHLTTMTLNMEQRHQSTLASRILVTWQEFSIAWLIKISWITLYTVSQADSQPCTVSAWGKQMMLYGGCQLYMCHLDANSAYALSLSLFVRPLWTTGPRLTQFLLSFFAIFSSSRAF